jgi:hypothetical protein
VQDASFRRHSPTSSFQDFACSAIGRSKQQKCLGKRKASELSSTSLGRISPRGSAQAGPGHFALGMPASHQGRRLRPRRACWVRGQLLAVGHSTAARTSAPPLVVPCSHNTILNSQSPSAKSRYKSYASLCTQLYAGSPENVGSTTEQHWRNSSCSRISDHNQDHNLVRLIKGAVTPVAIDPADVIKCYTIL